MTEQNGTPAEHARREAALAELARLDAPEVMDLPPRQTTDGWVPIPYTPGDPQPRIADGVYRGIRSDGRGGYEGLPRVQQSTAADRRADLMAAAQCLRCRACGSDQLQLTGFDRATAGWRCRMCRQEWRTQG